MFAPTFLHLLPLFALLCFGIPSCKKTPHQATHKEIRVGILFPITGQDSLYGREAMRGLEIALEQANWERRERSLGPIRVIVRDTQSKQGETSIAVRDLIYRQGVNILIGELDSGRCMEAAPIAERNGIPLISPAATNDRLTELGEFIFRTCFENSRQAKAMAQFAWNSGFRRVAMLIDLSKGYSSNLGHNFETEFRALGGTIVSRQNSSNPKDFSPQLTSIQPHEADLLVLPLLHVEGALAARQARELGLNMPILGGDGWDTPDLIALGGKFIEGSYFVTHFSQNSKHPAAVSFSQTYQTRFETPASALSALTHNAVLVLAAAVRDANTIPSTKIRENLMKIRNLPVATGMFSFTSNRNPRMCVFVVRVEKGAFVPCATLDP